MLTIGLLGGMSWESTVSYYQAINNGIKARLGGWHSGKICLYSVDFAEIEKLQHAGNWQQLARILSDAAKAIEAGGADFIVLCTNTMHKLAVEMEHNINIPLLHIADATAKQLLHDGIKTVGLLGTRFTMQEEFYKSRLSQKFGIQVLVPNHHDQRIVHDVIYQELCLGQIRDDSRAEYLKIVERLQAQGAQAVILGCTEIALLIQQQHTQVRLYDTTAIHAAAAVEYALTKT